ncbi:MAG TPA: ornithine carbamoyltransferase [Polyangiaceae bacterium LLY-WYZ-15_(1-7)]|nr:ornithine carbamoyltransferase [Myxococcales bacterium]MAT26463.1 ornithine carbamoyltransferase [Sandaracinus sp.]HJK91643.1 ornithine carbamoyltransferase [Polyangiaceae bacterium LLY-WYZ-15_(1-7)]MBJ74999.1 ornithine carbamoyltransferase [Sandaracinus sp.]HJL03669.1 ornithine carbamoyltransferase [Polyangiaceae bacterium LLY-WYZ-15_(1-7)]
MTAPRHFRTLEDLSADELNALLDRADELRATRGSHARPLEGKTVAIVLEKASTRTRLSFEVGVRELGGAPTTLIARDTQMGRGEPLGDTAHMLSGYVHGVVFRTFGHERVLELCATARIPVINGLSDTYHPCQLLADLQTVRAELGALHGVPVAWIGDGNNMAHSWILAAARTGLDLRLACPEAYAPDEAILARGRELGASITLTTDPVEAARGARVVTTDVWASMGQEEEQHARERAFAGFQVDAALMAEAADDAIFLHCLPAHRGEEVAAAVIDGPASRVWVEAENRLHAQKALLELLLS